MPTSVTLGNHFEEFIKKQLEPGRFSNISEVARLPVRLDHQCHAFRAGGSERYTLANRQPDALNTGDRGVQRGFSGSVF